MKDYNQSSVLTVGLAIFSMLFGAGNIIYPIKCGVITGSQNYIGVAGFILTGVFLPIIGLITMVLFEGDYRKFFYRIGNIPGTIAIFYCMFILGPLIAMPRCITVPFEMLKPFMPGINLPLFSVLFATITFLMSYKQSKILNLLGNVFSPFLLISLAIIAGKGLWQADHVHAASVPLVTVFLEQCMYGFQTLDLLGGLFFAYIVLRILKSNSQSEEINTKDLAIISLKSGLIAGVLLMLVYLAFSYLGAYYADLVSVDMNGAEMFRIISLHILNKQTIFIVILAVLVACLSTITAFAAIFAQYLHSEVFHKKTPKIVCLLMTMIATTVVANFGLTNILHYGMPVVLIGYPIIMMITFCNLGYILFDFQYIKLPVALTAMITMGMMFL